jgi:type II secretion system protein G
MRTQVKRAFTLIEILIVVVILGILAAIVIPQFTDASTQASEASVRSQLQTLRGQLELYRVQHNDMYPDLAADGWADMLTENYLQAAPKNPLQNNSTTIAAAPAAGVGWVWVSAGPADPDSQLSAVDAAGAVFVE